MKRDPVAEALQALSEAAGRPHDAATLALVRDSLAHRSTHVVARAARAARAGGIRGLVASGRPDVALLLRFLARRGDDEPGVLAEAFSGLLGLSADDPVPFVAQRLGSDNRDIARAAAMALGDCRRPEAVVALRERLPGEDRPDVRHAIILGLVASRDDRGFDAVLELVARGSAPDSKAAVEALRLYAHDDALQRRVNAALDARRPARLTPRSPGRRAGGTAP